MGRIMLPYLESVIVRKKARAYRYYWYRRCGRRIAKLPDINDEHFMAAYKAVHDGYGARDEEQRDFPPGTLGHLIAAYKASPDFKSLAQSTRSSYTRYLDAIEDKFKFKRVATIPRSFIYRERDRYQKTPRTANYVVSVVSLLLSFAIDQKQDVYGLRANPALKVKKLETGDGYRPWEEYEVKAFRAKWKIGTRNRTAFELFLNTGQRGSDVAPMSRPHYQDGAISVAKQEKTGERVWIPASKDLKDALDPWLKQNKHMVFLTGDKGGAMTIDYLRHEMRDAIRDAGLPDDCTLHGLRYTAARRLREIGCDWPTIADILGHRTAEMTRKYSEKQRRSKIAIAKLDRATREG